MVVVPLPIGAKEDLKGKAIRGGVAKLSAQGFTFGLRLVFLMVMARLLRPEDFGLVAMVTAVTGFYELFTTADSPAAAVQKLTITDGELSTLFWVNIVVGAALSAACMVTAPVISNFYHEPRLLWVTVAIACGFMFNAAGVQHFALLQRELRYPTLATMEIMAQLSSIAVGVGLALAGFGYWSLVVATVALPAMMTSFLWAATGWIPGRPQGISGIFPLLRFGGTITLNNLVVQVAYNCDKLLIGRVLGADILGVYGRAYQLVNIPNTTLLSAVGSVAFSTLSTCPSRSLALPKLFFERIYVGKRNDIPDDYILCYFCRGNRFSCPWSQMDGYSSAFSSSNTDDSGIRNNQSDRLASSIGCGLHRRSLYIALVIAPLVVAACVAGLAWCCGSSLRFLGSDDALACAARHMVHARDDDIGFGPAPGDLASPRGKFAFSRGGAWSGAVLVRWLDAILTLSRWSRCHGRLVCLHLAFHYEAIAALS